ncbi:MAG: hypothetical protein K8R46_06120 [Pirellulales bacterium]|nr:hypothetical protein [Pirellulales bacterium]
MNRLTHNQFRGALRKGLGRAVLHVREIGATGVAKQHGYFVSFQPTGPDDANLGSPKQMGIFRLQKYTKGATDEGAIAKGL